MTEFTLEELAEKSGVPARTIRFYIARKLLPGPLRAGPGAVYGRAHLERLARIRKLQARGLALAEIARILGGEKPSDGLPAPTAWWSYALSHDVVVWIRADAAPWRLKHIRQALLAAASALNSHQEDKIIDDSGS